MGNSKNKIISAVLVIALLTLIVLFYKCPVKSVFGIPCPGCGMTRAYQALMSGNLSGAFNWHPLFPIPIITIWYAALRPQLGRLKKFEYVTIIVFVMLFIAVWGIRLKSTTLL